MKYALVLAVMAIVAVTSMTAQGANWTPKTAGTYAWNSGANWDAAFPNAAGAVANFNVGLTGSQTVTLGQAITVGTINLGDTGGTAGVTTAINTGTLTFQGATAGAATAVNLNLSTVPQTGSGLTLPNIRLAGTSPLTISINSPATATYNSSISTVDLGANTFTLKGPPRTNGAITGNSIGPSVGVSSISGSGNYVQNGAATALSSACPAFTGTVTVNNGMFTFAQGSMKAASSYVFAGAWGNFTKYPRGGYVGIGHFNWPAYNTLPDRLNHAATMVFKSGYLEYFGQALTSNLTGQPVVEQVRQIEFASGMSQIRMSNGNEVSSSTTLLANDPVKACLRRQGATLHIGGDDARSNMGTYWLAMGIGEKLIFASGMNEYLKGAGGPAGSKTMSIVPWMIDGTVYHPGQGLLVTYDNTNGVRCLAPEEYYFIPTGGSVYGIDPTYNVRSVWPAEMTNNLNLGTGHTQTINSYSTSNYNNMDIGAGSTLTVTSGAIHFGEGPASIGMTPSAAGTLNFGPAEGIIWTTFESAYGPNRIGSVIAGSGGLTQAGNNELVLTAVNTYTGKTGVGSGIMTVGDGVLTTSKLGNGDVDVAAGGTLRIKTRVANAILDSAAVFLGNNGDVFFGMVDLGSGVNETVGNLIINGARQPAGTYGSSSSSATHKLDSYFSGTGILTVTGVDAAMAGDFNDDGTVNQADYTAWADNFGGSDWLLPIGSTNGDGKIDQADYTRWADQFGQSALIVVDEQAAPAVAVADAPAPTKAQAAAAKRAARADGRSNLRSRLAAIRAASSGSDQNSRLEHGCQG